MTPDDLKHALSGGLLSFPLTDFDARGVFDSRASASRIEWLMRYPAAAMFSAGGAGEFFSLTAEEYANVLRVAVQTARGKIPVIGAAGYGTATAISYAQKTEKIGADGLLLVTPYYNKPGQAGVLHHFRTVAEATGVPVMLYDVPGRTGTTISLETYAAAKEIDTVVAVKDAVNDFVRGVRLQQLGYAVYSGDDASNLGWLAHGAAGFVSVVGHVAGDETRAMLEAFDRGDHAEALAIFTRLLPAIDAVMGAANYGATTAKAGLQLLGVLDNRNVRGPLVPLDDDEVAALRAGLEASGLL